MDALKYLEKYGYVYSSSSTLSSMIRTSSAIKEFQRFAGLSENGKLDEATLAKMNSPRCGVPDKVENSESTRKKRYALKGGKWPKDVLTYRIDSYPRHRLHDRGQVDREVQRAFQLWSETANLRFVRSEHGQVDIEIQFAEGEHGDGNPFDGPGNTLAHAFFPMYGGNAHFDDTEKWTIDDADGTNLLQVATHEFGHSLGLFHSDVKTAVMAPYYSHFIPDFRLDPDDEQGIQVLYGKREHLPPPEPRPPPPPGAPDLCRDAAIQAVTTTWDGRTYVFRGDYYWEIRLEKKNQIAPGYPRRISDDWGGLPGDMDAALTWPNGNTYIFKGHQYWRFKNRNMDPGYPKDISKGFAGIPNDIDAAFVWSGNGKTYFFKGSEYWKFELDKRPRVHPKYPKPISKWPGVPTHITAAFQWVNKKTYFFKGDQYYKFNDGTFTVFLEKFGYLTSSSNSISGMANIQIAVKEFQRFTGLSETGKIDQSTLRKMNTPRCGVKDNVGHGGAARKKRYALQGGKWSRNVLAYKITKYPRHRLHDRGQVDREIDKAFQTWTRAANIRFVRQDHGPIDIEIRWEEGDHNCVSRFDGPGTTLAHAYFPEHGDAHFDDAEQWTIGAGGHGVDLMQVAVHEFGHSLGLDHSDVDSAIMAPTFRYQNNFRLNEDDIQAIQALYGRRGEHLPPPEPKPPAPPGAPDLCRDAAIQAVTTTGDGRTYVFKGDYYWEIRKEKKNKIAPGFPRRISDDWGGLPGHINAAVTWSNGNTYIFKRHQYWRFKNRNMDPGYPKDISHGFKGIPNDIDAAVVWSGNGKTYFFKGSQYWKYDRQKKPRISSKYPRSISRWPGVPADITAAFQWVNRKTYFFKGNQYYKFNDKAFKVEEAHPGYPRSIARWWLDC